MVWPLASETMIHGSVAAFSCMARDNSAFTAPMNELPPRTTWLAEKGQISHNPRSNECPYTASQLICKRLRQASAETVHCMRCSYLIRFSRSSPPLTSRTTGSAVGAPNGVEAHVADGPTRRPQATAIPDRGPREPFDRICATVQRVRQRGAWRAPLERIRHQDVLARWPPAPASRALLPEIPSARQARSHGADAPGPGRRPAYTSAPRTRLPLRPARGEPAFRCRLAPLRRTRSHRYKGRRA